jgi:ribosomal protein S18 acetylase RimI-like enzyme
MYQSVPARAKLRAAVRSVGCSARPRAEDIVVRRPSEADIVGLAAHFLEMQSHYKQPVSDAAAMKAAVLACKVPTGTFDPRVLVALAGDEVVGSLVMNVTFPASELSLALYIRDLYVAKVARRCGVGQMLVRAATHLRASEGFSALEWTTDSTNAAARRLYEACGARQVERTYFNERRGLCERRRVNRQDAAERRLREAQVPTV